MTTLAGHGKDPHLVQVELPVVPKHGFKVGDFIKDKDNFIGQIKSACDRCITAFNKTCVKSYNLTEFKDINSFIKRLPDIAESELCSPTLTCLAESELSLSQPETLEKSLQSPTSTSTRTRKKSINATSLKSQSIATSETIAPLKELTSLQEASHAQEPVEQVQKLDLTTPNLSSGLNISDASKKGSPNLQSSKIPQDYSIPIAEWEKSSKAYPKAGICVNGRLSPLPYLEVPKREKGCSSLPIPTLTTGLGSGRNAGATKLEKWLKDNHFVQSTQALSAEMMAVLFGFPKDWTECLLESPKESEAETRLEPCLGEQSMSIAPPSQSNKSSTYTEFSANNIDARLEFLLEQRDRLIASGACPDGVWINCGKVPNRDFKQAVWKSHKPRAKWDNKKSKYIGEFGKEAHISAIAQHRAGQELRKVEREIRKLQKS
jgi:hypothetical protein